MKTALIISCYNQHETLRKALLGVLVQTVRDFETIVADDGSTAETAAVVRRPEFASLNIKHLWQADLGFRKLRVQNLAIANTTADYCIFLDGDTIPRADYIESHLVHSRPRCFLSGSRVNFAERFHTQFTDEQILSNEIFDLNFWREREPRMQRYRYRLGNSRWKGLFNFLSYRPRAMFGSNCSAWRKDLLKVNGCNESLTYGSEDRELGMRLSNAGVYSDYLKFSLIQGHLDHYSNPNKEQLRANRRRFQRLYFVRESWTPVGLDTILERDREERDNMRDVYRRAA